MTMTPDDSSNNFTRRVTCRIPDADPDHAGLSVVL
jgi:hypothetical protein